MKQKQKYNVGDKVYNKSTKSCGYITDIYVREDNPPNIPLYKTDNCLTYQFESTLEYDEVYFKMVNRYKVK